MAGEPTDSEAADKVPETELSWKPFRARYSVYRNGKLIGKSNVVMDFSGTLWSIKSETRGTHGLAKLLKARDNGYVDGHLDEGRFIPDNYSQHTRVIGMDNRWTAQFDWQNNRVHITQDRKEMDLDLGEGGLDPLTITMEIRRHLRQNNHQLRFWRIDEDKLKDQEFRVLETQLLETSLGCIATIPVERIHRGGKRYTRAWHAPSLEFLTVRLEHGKQGGEHIEMRIAQLTLASLPVEPVPGCQSGQVGKVTR